VASTAEELFAAIEADDAGRVRRLLEEEPSLATARDGAGVSALMRARYRPNPAIVDAVRARVDELDVFEAATFSQTDRLAELLEGDPALVTAYAGDGFTPLHFAAFFGSSAAVSLLLERGAPVDALGRGWMTGTALHSAAARADAGIVRILLDAGANPDARQSAGGTPLHAAATNGDLASAEALLDAGADPALTMDDGRSALDLALERGDAGTIERIRSAVQAAP
jgi:uncharacterized protein